MPHHTARRIFLVALLALCAPAAWAELPSRIVFGSCARQDRPQPIWNSILALKPELCLLIGDNIYGDTTDMAVLKAKYEMFGAVPGYQALKAACPVLATWDDHDYGANDAGVEYAEKRASQRLFLDFFEAPKDSPLRRQEGVYNAKVYEAGGRRLQVILLDTRYFRSPLLKAEPEEIRPGRKIRRNIPNADPKSTILGEAQWRWLEEQLRQPADLRIIGSSIQVLPEDHRFEKWANFPLERERLFRLIEATRARGVILLSGDRHMAEISRLNPRFIRPVGYPLYEVTSSGLTHAGGGTDYEPNRHRISPHNFRELNFGSIEVDWQAPDPSVALRVHSASGGVVLEKVVPLSELTPR